MLLSSGCSFTVGQYGENKVYDKPYPALLAEKLDVSFFNFGEPGADNTFIISNLLKYLFSFEEYKLNKPKYITVQISDFFRYLLCKRKTKKSYISPNQPSFKTIPRKQFVKVNSHGFEKDKDLPSSFIVKKVSNTIVKLYREGKVRQILDSTDLVAFGDPTYNEPKMRCLLLLNSLNTLCEALDIHLCIINYYDFGDWVDDPLFKNLKSKCLIANPRFGLYNELVWLGFDRPDGYHFNEEAHLWQAETIELFFKDNKQLTVHTEKAPNYDPTIVFDYRDEL